MKSPEKNKDARFIKIDSPHVRQELFILALRYNIKNFVETGTHVGATVIHMAARNYFDNIFSVELSKHFIDILERDLHRGAASFGVDISKVKIWGGDSVEKLPEMLSRVDGRAVFWLDAHYSSGETVRSECYNCTMIKELEIIANHHIKDHVIAIDDMEQCLNGHADYPSIKELEDKILSINSDYMITIKYNALFAEVPSTAPNVSDKAKEEFKNHPNYQGFMNNA